MPDSSSIFWNVSIMSVVYLVLFQIFTYRINGIIGGNFMHYGAIFWIFMLIAMIIVPVISSWRIHTNKIRFYFHKMLLRVLFTPCVTINFLIIWIT